MIHSRGLNSSRHGSGELRIASPQVSDLDHCCVGLETANVSLYKINRVGWWSLSD
jgi:hypothetical protein